MSRKGTLARKHATVLLNSLSAEKTGYLFPSAVQNPIMSDMSEDKEQPRGIAWVIWTLEHAQDVVSVIVGVMLVALAVGTVLAEAVGVATKPASTAIDASMHAAELRLVGCRDIAGS